MSLDVVIVHYTSGALLRRCVDALPESVPDGGSIVVVDNRAPDPVPDAVLARPGLTVVRADANLGFARGANLGAGHGSSEWMLLLNPDVRPSSPVLDGLRAVLTSRPELAACAPALRDPDGTLQVGAAGYLPTITSVTRQAFPIAPLLGFHSGRPLFVPRGRRCPDGEPIAVDWLSAACLLVRRRAFEQVGGFDERFFLYGEDVDLGKRLRAAGWGMAYAPWLAVEHLHLQASRQGASRASDWAWIDGMDTYYRLHVPGARRLLHAIACCGFALRAALPATRSDDRGDLREHRDRMRAFMRRSAHHARTA